MFAFVIIVFARLAITTAPVPPRGACDMICAEAYSFYVANGGGK